MANDLNQCNFIGRLGQDPEIRYTQDSKPIANISLAVGWKSKEREGTEWVRCVAFGKLAEIMGEYLRKGSKVYLSGSMRTRKWQNQQGQDQYTTEIVANDMKMLDGKQQGKQQGGPQQSHSSQGYQQGQRPQQPTQGAQGQQQGYGTTQNPTDFDDDIPF